MLFPSPDRGAFSSLQAQDKLKARGIDTIAVVSMDTPFAMHAWSKQLGADDVLFLSDPLGHLAKALGVTFHAGPLGLRSSRYEDFDRVLTNSTSSLLLCLQPGTEDRIACFTADVQTLAAQLCNLHLVLILPLGLYWL